MKNLKTKNQKEKVYRHGEILLRPIAKLPSGLKKADTKTIIAGSHGNAHTISAGELFFHQADTYIFGYLKAQKTTLLHPEHGEGKSGLLKASIPDGIYELRKQQEFINNELKPVVD
jgi:hypothetical protein